MFKTIALVVLCVLVLSVVSVLGFAATKPDTFRIARTTTIKAPPERVFPLINDLHKQLTWIPFDKDPAATRSFSGTPSGKGAAYAWDGNSDVGAGSIEITDATRAIQSDDEARNDTAVRDPQYRRVHARSWTWRRHNPGHVVHARRTALPGQDRVGLHGLR